MPPKHKYICADCGELQDSMDQKCIDCGSLRVILLSIVEASVGADWRKVCFPSKVYKE